MKRVGMTMVIVVAVTRFLLAQDVNNLPLFSGPKFHSAFEKQAFQQVAHPKTDPVNSFHSIDEKITGQAPDTLSPGDKSIFSGFTARKIESKTDVNHELICLLDSGHLSSLVVNSPCTINGNNCL